MSKERAIDNKNEEIMNVFFEKTLYPAFINFGLMEDAELIRDKNRQVNGMDAIFKVNGDSIVIDNKTRWSMTNRYCEKIAVELRTNNQAGHRFTGWGINPHETNYWMFVHILRADGGNGKGKKCNVTPDNIEKIIIEFIRPDEFHKWLDVKGVTPEKLEQMAIDAEAAFAENTEGLDDIPVSMRQFTYENFRFFNRKTWQHDYDAYISVSADKGMDEDPTNLVINEFVVDNFPSSRVFIWEKDTGLREVPNKRHAPKPLHI